MCDPQTPLTHEELTQKALDAFDELLSRPPADEVEARRQWFNVGWLCRQLWEESKE